MSDNSQSVTLSCRRANNVSNALTETLHASQRKNRSKVLQFYFKHSSKVFLCTYYVLGFREFNFCLIYKYSSKIIYIEMNMFYKTILRNKEISNILKKMAGLRGYAYT